MKHLLLIFCGFALLISSCTKECECPKPDCDSEDLKNGLLAYYPFNGNFNDESGNGNHGTPVNGAGLTSDFLGRSSKAAGFDGNNDYIIVQHNGKLNSEEVTVSAMIMVNNINRRHAIVSLVNSDNASAFVYGLGQSLDITNRWDFGVGTPKEDCSKPLAYHDSTYARNPETGEVGRWYHLMGIFSKGEQKLYVDGELRITKTRDFSVLRNCNSTQLLIGGWWKNDIVSIAGKIDEVRIYNRVLSDCEIAELTKTFKR